MELRTLLPGVGISKQVELLRQVWGLFNSNNGSLLICKYIFIVVFGIPIRNSKIIKICMCVHKDAGTNWRSLAMMLYLASSGAISDLCHINIFLYSAKVFQLTRAESSRNLCKDPSKYWVPQELHIAALLSVPTVKLMTWQAITKAFQQISDQAYLTLKPLYSQFP